MESTFLQKKIVIALGGANAFRRRTVMKTIWIFIIGRRFPALSQGTPLKRNASDCGKHNFITREPHHMKGACDILAVQ